MRHIGRVLILTAAVVFVPLAGCSQKLERAGAPSPSSSIAEGEWPHYNGSYSATRFSPLTEITRKSVAQLAVHCSILLGDEGAFQTSPLVVGGTLYVTTSHNTGAFDAGTCAKKWVTQYTPEEPYVYGTNRGAAYLNNRVFRGTGDGRLIAMNASDGHVIWKIKEVDPKKGLFLSAAPIAWNGLVFIGAAGSDWGARGQMMAYDAATGKRVWLFHTVPAGNETGADTWKNRASVATGGGALWTSVTLDPATGELFVPVGNPAPDFDGTQRPGANLFTDSFVVLDANSGKLRWWYQLVPHDTHDYDLGAPPVLYNDANGKAMVAAAGKDGYVHLIDREKHTLRSKTAVSTIKNATMEPTIAGIDTCPGPLGGTEWFGPAVDAARNTMFVGSNDLCGVYKRGGVNDVEGQSFYGGKFAATGKPSGWLTALDGTTGKIKWRNHLAAPNVGGIVATASSVVFAGDLAGTFYAVNGDTGSQLGSWHLPGSISGGIVTYLIGGKQYVAVPNGGLSRFFGGIGSPRVTVFAVGATNPKVVDVRSSPGVLAQSGAAIFETNCSACHGVAGAGGVAPSLRGERTRKNLAQAIAWIKNPAPPMPKLYPTPLNEQQVQAVAKYIESL